MLTASKPLEHILLIAMAHEVSGNPPIRAAILTCKTPAPDYNTFPTITSSILDGSILVYSIIFLNKGVNIASHGVSLNPPFLDLVSAVLTARQITTSSGSFFY